MVRRRASRSSGYGGQAIVVSPERELVFVSQIWIDPATGNEQLVADEVAAVFTSTIYPASPPD